MESQITLREALDKFNKKNMKYFSDRDISEEAKVFFKCHDVAHIVFDCDTSILGEGIVKTWTIFGTTLGFWNHLKGYEEASAFQLFRMYSWQHVIKNIFKLIFTLPSVVIRAKRMNKLWPWIDFEPYLDMKIDDIRSEFNIKTLDLK